MNHKVTKADALLAYRTLLTNASKASGTPVDTGKVTLSQFELERLGELVEKMGNRAPLNFLLPNYSAELVKQGAIAWAQRANQTSANLGWEEVLQSAPAQSGIEVDLERLAQSMNSRGLVPLSPEGTRKVSEDFQLGNLASFEKAYRLEKRSATEFQKENPIAHALAGPLEEGTQLWYRGATDQGEPVWVQVHYPVSLKHPTVSVFDALGTEIAQRTMGDNSANALVSRDEPPSSL